MEWDSDVPKKVAITSSKTEEAAKVPILETQSKPDPIIQTAIKPLEFTSTNASKRASGMSLVSQRLLIHNSPLPRVIPDKVPIRQVSPPPTNFAKRKLTIKPEETILVVIDTNIFLNSLSFVKTLVGQRQKRKLSSHYTLSYLICSIAFPVKGNPTLMVPYQVLQELDNIKDCSKKNETIKSLAMDSIKYLEQYLQGGDDRVQGKLPTGIVQV